jgi:hypothetical protein
MSLTIVTILLSSHGQPARRNCPPTGSHRFQLSSLRRSRRLRVESFLEGVHAFVTLYGQLTNSELCEGECVFSARGAVVLVAVRVLSTSSTYV